MAQCKAGNPILILPSSSYEIGSISQKKTKTPKKCSGHICGTPGTDDLGGSSHDPRNFLVRGGQRALEQKLLSINKCAMQELRNANAVLAEELLKARSGSDQVRDQLREKELNIEALQATIERLEKARKLLDKKHLLQLKELNRRYKEEQALRLALESECAQLRASKDVVHQQVDSLQEERAQLVDLLNSQRSSTSRLEATNAADAATIAELRSRTQTAESRLSDEMAARQDLFGRHKSLEAELKLATERHSALVASSSEAEARMRAAISKAELLDDELEAAKKALQAEKAAFAAERQRATILQSDLTQLQTSSQLAAAAAAADQAEVERLRGQTEQLMASNEALRTDIARLREEVLHLTSQQMAAKASSQNLQQQCEDLQQQRDDLRQQLTEANESRERLEWSLREEVAARARAVQETEFANQRAHAEELATKQRQWEGQLRAREKAWEDERMVMQRGHQDELSRKDMELFEVRERMREAQASVAEMAVEVSTFKFQGQHYAEVFNENEELKRRLTRADETVAARDASLAEAASSHAGQLEMWKAEANEVAQAAAKWKQRCASLQAQLEAKESELNSAEQEVRLLASRLNSSETERVRLQEMLASAESKMTLANQESNSYRSQLADVLTSNETLTRQVETARQDVQLRDLQISKLSQSLGEEAARAAQLRQELAAAVAQNAKDLDAKRRTLDDLTDQLQEAERARAVAQADADRLREKVALLTREVGRARMIADTVKSRSATATAAATATGLRRSADTAPDGWGDAYAHKSTRGRGEGSSGARRPSDSLDLDLDEEAAVDRRAYLHRASGQSAGSSGAAVRLTSDSMDMDYDATPDRRGKSRCGGTKSGGESVGNLAIVRSSRTEALGDVGDAAEEEEVVDKRTITYRGRKSGSRRRDYDFTSIEEAEDWFKVLDAERRRLSERRLGGKDRSRPASRSTPPHGQVDAQPKHQRSPDTQSQSHRQQQQQPHHHHHHRHVHHDQLPHPRPASAQTQNDPTDVDEADCFKTYDVTISPKPGGGSLSEGGGPMGLQQPPSPAAAYPTQPVASGVLSASGVAAAAAAAAYTAIVTAVEHAPSGFGTALATTPHPTPVVQQPRMAAPPVASSSPSSSSVSRTAKIAQRPTYRGYGTSASHQQPLYPYARGGDAGRVFGAATPLSPVFSDSASTASSSLQERLHRLLGTGKLS